MNKRDRLYKQQQATRRGHRRFQQCLRRSSRIQSVRYRSMLPPDATIEYLASNLKKLAGGKIPHAQPVIDGYITIRVPRFFSLSQAPSESFPFLASLIRSLHNVQAPLLVLDYQDCERVDLDASVVTDAILRLFIKRHNLLRHHFRERAVTCGIRAVNMHRLAVRKFFWSIGAGQSIHGLGLQYPDILVCPLKTGRRDPNRLGRNEVTVTALFEHLEKSLARFGKQLTPKDAERFGDIIGEVLDNAEQHSSLPYNYAIAHFQEHNGHSKENSTAEVTLKEMKEDHFGRFQIVIFNFGQTIYERLNDPQACLTANTILPRMRELSAHYTRRRLFGMGSRPFQEETLWTLYALQDGVSSLRLDRGRGTIRFITDFLTLRSKAQNKKSLLTLMSGQTRIHFDGSYGIVQARNSFGEMQRRITFNDTGSLDEPPNPRVVTFVPHYLPGTLLYADIYLTDDHLQST